MGTTEKFCLKWNDFQQNIISTFESLREDTDYTDVTLACEDGQQVEAHKVILAASSPFFQILFRRNRHAHPLIYMRGMKSEDIVAILDFLYYGEANIFQENLDAFLILAEELKLKGLTQDNDEAKIEPGPSETLKKDVKVKSSCDSRTINQKVSKANLESYNSSMEAKHSCEDVKDETVSERSVSLPNQSLQELDTQIRSMMAPGKQIMVNGKKAESLCQACGKEGAYQTIKDHIEAHHIEGVSHSCNVCEKTFRSRPALYMHNKRNHT